MCGKKKDAVRYVGGREGAHGEQGIPCTFSPRRRRKGALGSDSATYSADVEGRLEKKASVCEEDEEDEEN